TVTGNTWSVTVPNASALIDEFYNVTATATDSAGKTGESDPANPGKLTVDTAPPTALGGNLGGVPSTNKRPTLTGSATDLHLTSSIDHVVVKLINSDTGVVVQTLTANRTSGLTGGIVAFGNETSDSVAQWTVTATSDVPDGTYDVEVTAFDTAGNSGGT